MPVFTSTRFIILLARKAPHYSHIYSSCILHGPQIFLLSMDCYCVWCASRILWPILMSSIWSSPFIYNLRLRHPHVHNLGNDWSFCDILKLAQMRSVFFVFFVRIMTNQSTPSWYQSSVITRILIKYLSSHKTLHTTHLYNLQYVASSFFSFHISKSSVPFVHMLLSRSFLYLFSFVRECAVFWELRNQCSTKISPSSKQSLIRWEVCQNIYSHTSWNV